MLAVYTSDDLGREPLSGFADVNDKAGRAALAVDKVRYVGDPVALVVAETRAQAMDAAELVDVDYDDLPAVTDIEDALADDAPLQFEAIGSNIATQRAAKDASDVLDDADHVTRVRMVNQRIATAPIEGNAILVRPTADGMEAWVSTQHPHMARDLLAKAIGVEAAHVRVVAPHVGGAFGGKAGSGPDHAAIALAARKLGHPVKWSETRSEAMLSMQGRGQVQYAELGLKDDGTITGLRTAGARRVRRVRRLRRRARGRTDVHDGPGSLRHPAAALRRDRGDDQHRARSARSAAPAGPRPPPRSTGSSTSPPQELGHQPGGDPPPQPDPGRRVPLPDPDRRDLRQRRLPRCPSRRRCGSPASTTRARSSSAGSRPARASCSASGSRRTSRSPASAARSSARSRSTPTARRP